MARLVRSAFQFRVGDGSPDGAVVLFSNNASNELIMSVTRNDETTDYEFGLADSLELAKGIRKLNGEASRNPARKTSTDNGETPSDSNGTDSAPETPTRSRRGASES